MYSPHVLTQLVELTANVTNAFTVALFVADLDQKKLFLKESLSLSLNFQKNTELNFGQGLIGQVALTGKPLLEEYFRENSKDLGIYSQKEDLKGFIAVPIFYDKLVGVLAVDSKESYHFSTRSQKLVTGFADQMAWHLHQEKLFTGNSGDNLFPYKEVIAYSQSIADSLHPAAMAEQMVQIPSSILEYDSMAVVWLDDEQTMGKVVHSVGWGEDLNHWEVFPGRGVAGSTIKNGIPLLVKDLEKNKSVLFREKEKLNQFQCAISAPIMFKNHLLAVLVCASKNPEGLTKTHLDRLNMVGSFVAPALFYAREKRQWDYDKNLDQVTGIPNHRCLVAYRENIEKEVIRGHKRIFFLSVYLKNLLTLYETHGVVIGDQLLKQVVSLLSKTTPSPKFLFKYSDTSFLIMVMKMDQNEIESLETRLKQVFEKNPFFVNGVSLKLKADLGLSIFPDDGNNLCELAGLSWARSSQNSTESHAQKTV